MAQLLTVLIVDDCPEDRETYRRYLLQDQEYSYKILEEESGEGALTLCREFQPDVILLDLLLPDMDGLEFIAELKQETEKFMPAVIMLTGYGNETVAVQAMKSGVQDYLVKGETTGEYLRSTLHSVVKNAQLLQELQRSEERFRTSVENMLDCFGIFSAVRHETGEILYFRVDYMNAAAYEFSQMSSPEPGEHLCKILLNIRENGLFDECCQVVETGQPLAKESLVCTGNQGEKQSRRVIDIRLTKMGDSFVAAWRDVTAKKEAEAALRESEERYRYLSDSIPQLVWISNIEGECEHINQQWYEVTGLTWEDMQGFGWKQVIHPDELAAVMSQWRHCLQTGEPYQQEMRYRKFDGSYCWYLVRSVPIEDDQGNIVKWFGTSTDIDERKQLEAERDRLLQLEQTARNVAETANQTKDEFVAMVSHDLRSPLNAILGWTKLLQTRKLDANQVRRALETIERNAQSQAKLLEDLLNMSRILRGQLQLELYPVELVSIVKAAVETAYPSAHAQGIHLESIIDESVPSIMGDPHRLLQILGNLLSNAIKFTPSGGRVQVLLAKSTDSLILIQVSDTGLGINSEFLPYVFERYHQANYTCKHSGLGLGLAIARHLVELHGGTITAHSPGKGQGSTFSILLPLQVN
jgi:PAS domain S-box-containing protein